MLRQTTQKQSSDKPCFWSKVLLMETIANEKEICINIQLLYYILSSQKAYLEVLFIWFKVISLQGFQQVV